MHFFWHAACTAGLPCSSMITFIVPRAADLEAALLVRSLYHTFCLSRSGLRFGIRASSATFSGAASLAVNGGRKSYDALGGGGASGRRSADSSSAA